MISWHGRRHHSRSFRHGRRGLGLHQPNHLSDALVVRKRAPAGRLAAQDAGGDEKATVARGGADLVEALRVGGGHRPARMPVSGSRRFQRHHTGHGSPASPCRTGSYFSGQIRAYSASKSRSSASNGTIASTETGAKSASLSLACSPGRNRSWRPRKAACDSNIGGFAGSIGTPVSGPSYLTRPRAFHDPRSGTPNVRPNMHADSGRGSPMPPT